MNQSVTHLAEKGNNQSVNSPTAKWNNLPKDLIQQISKHLKTSIDILRFRSVCSSWRSAIPPPPPITCDIFPDESYTSTRYRIQIEKRTLFLLRLPYPCNQTQASSHWLIKVETDVPQSKQFLNPLSRHELDAARYNLPRVLDLLKFRVLELGQEFLLRHIESRSDIKDWTWFHDEKVVMLRLCGDQIQNQNQENFFLLAINCFGSNLGLFRSVDKKWNMIQETHCPGYSDVIVYKDRFYAVDEMGRTVLVGLNSDLSLVANPVDSGGYRKFLVDSDGELLLVDMHVSDDMEESSISDGEDFVTYPQQYAHWGAHWGTVVVKVFRLDFETQSWVEVSNLGDKVLFVGEDVTLSLSVSNLHGCKGNCVFFYTDEFSTTGVYDGDLAWNYLAVFDLETQSIVSSENAREYFKIFLPPPSWAISRRVSTSSNVENQELQQE